MRILKTISRGIVFICFLMAGCGTHREVNSEAPTSFDSNDDSVSVIYSVEDSVLTSESQDNSESVESNSNSVDSVDSINSDDSSESDSNSTSESFQNEESQAFKIEMDSLEQFQFNITDAVSLGIEGNALVKETVSAEYIKLLEEVTFKEYKQSSDQLIGEQRYLAKRKEGDFNEITGLSFGTDFVEFETNTNHEYRLLNPDGTERIGWSLGTGEKMRFSDLPIGNRITFGRFRVESRSIDCEIRIKAEKGLSYSIEGLIENVTDNSTNDKDPTIGFISIDGLVEKETYTVRYEGTGMETTINQIDIDADIDKVLVYDSHYSFISFVSSNSNCRANGGDLLGPDEHGIIEYDKLNYNTNAGRISFVLDNGTGCAYKIDNFLASKIENRLILSGSNSLFDFKIENNQIIFYPVYSNSSMAVSEFYKDRYGNRLVFIEGYYNFDDVENHTIYCGRTQNSTTLPRYYFYSNTNELYFYSSNWRQAFYTFGDRYLRKINKDCEFVSIPTSDNTQLTGFNFSSESGNSEYYGCLPIEIVNGNTVWTKYRNYERVFADVDTGIQYKSEFMMITGDGIFCTYRVTDPDDNILRNCIFSLKYTDDLVTFDYLYGYNLFVWLDLNSQTLYQVRGLLNYSRKQTMENQTDWRNFPNLIEQIKNDTDSFEIEAIGNNVTYDRNYNKLSLITPFGTTYVEIYCEMGSDGRYQIKLYENGSGGKKMPIIPEDGSNHAGEDLDLQSGESNQNENTSNISQGVAGLHASINGSFEGTNRIELDFSKDNLGNMIPGTEPLNCDATIDDLDYRLTNSTLHSSQPSVGIEKSFLVLYAKKANNVASFSNITSINRLVGIEIVFPEGTFVSSYSPIVVDFGDAALGATTLTGGQTGGSGVTLKAYVEEGFTASYFSVSCVQGVSSGGKATWYNASVAKINIYYAA